MPLLVRYMRSQISMETISHLSGRATPLDKGKLSLTCSFYWLEIAAKRASDGLGSAELPDLRS
jgi:hypothetical protein